MLEKLKSRKLWAGVVGSALGYLLAQLGFEAATIAVVLAPLVAYIAGETLVDKAREGG